MYVYMYVGNNDANVTDIIIPAVLVSQVRAFLSIGFHVNNIMKMMMCIFNV